MKKNKMKIVGTILILLCLINTLGFVYAKEHIYTDDLAKIKFNIDYSIWEKTELSKERNFISDKWVTDNGVLIYGSNDFYSVLSESDKRNLSRQQFNDSLIDSSSVSDLVNDLVLSYSFDEWMIINYNLRFIAGQAVANINGINLETLVFLSINNGHLIMFQYSGDMSSESIKEVKSIIASVNYSDNNITNLNNNNANPIKNSGINEPNFDIFTKKNIPKLLFLLLLTILFYMIFPLLRLVVNKSKFDRKTANSIALWNSIVVGLIFLIWTGKNGGEWNAGRAIFYYFINKMILTKKDQNRITESIEDNNLESS